MVALLTPPTVATSSSMLSARAIVLIEKTRNAVTNSAVHGLREIPLMKLLLDLIKSFGIYISGETAYS
jgi:hypothetical protein